MTTSRNSDYAQFRIIHSTQPLAMPPQIRPSNIIYRLSDKSSMLNNVNIVRAILRRYTIITRTH